MQTYPKKLKEHVERMQYERLAKLALKYQPVENKVEVIRRRVGKTRS
jgi:hypothetical protein